MQSHPPTCANPHHDRFIVAGELCLACIVNQFGLLRAPGDKGEAGRLLQRINTVLLPEFCSAVRRSGIEVLKAFCRSVARCWDYGDSELSKATSNVRMPYLSSHTSLSFGECACYSSETTRLAHSKALLQGARLERASSFNA